MAPPIFKDAALAIFYTLCVFAVAAAVLLTAALYVLSLGYVNGFERLATKVFG